MKIKRKNAFWTFCFSFLPGCAEMYWGFMQAGMSLLLTFAGILFVAVFLEMPVFILFAVVVYVYSFFHARNMAHMTEEELLEAEDGKVSILEGLELPVDRIKKHQLAKWGGVLLILFGAYMLLELGYRNISLPEFVNDYLQRFLYSFPQIVIAVLLILLGCRLVLGKKRAFEEEDLAKNIEDEGFLEEKEEKTGGKSDEP